jgi:RNA-directed DNA polymerase
MNHWNSQRYLQAGRKANKDEVILRRAVQTAKVTLSANTNSPPIFTLGHLAHQVGVPYEFLRAVVSRGGMEEDTFYRVFSLKKRNVGFANGRTRTICAPQPLLLKTQRWIHDKVLKNGKFHEASRAYIPGSKIVEAADLHCDAKWMVKLDITNFFESITEQKVYKVFRSFGYQPLVSFELARICTRPKNGNKLRLSAHPRKIIAYDDKRLGRLPQGAPTSPLLANLVTFGLDVALAALAAKFDTVYTRYADDITFSSSTAAWSRPTAAQLLRQGHEILRSHGFVPNQAKAHIVSPGSRKIMLGVAVQDSIPRLTRDFKNKLRAHIYYLRKFGDDGTLPHVKLGFDSILGLQRHVFGLAYYAKGIEREWGELRLLELKALSWPTDHGILFD